MRELPKDGQRNPPVEIKFLRQNVQINIGCNFNYSPKKARRYPIQPFPPEIKLDKNHFFPLLLDEWPSMKEENKAFWRERLKEVGIILPDPAPSKPKHRPQRVRKPRKRKKIFSKLMEQSMTIVSSWLGRLRIRWSRHG